MYIGTICYSKIQININSIVKHKNIIMPRYLVVLYDLNLCSIAV